VVDLRIRNNGLEFGGDLDADARIFYSSFQQYLGCSVCMSTLEILLWEVPLMELIVFMVGNSSEDDGWHQHAWSFVVEVRTMNTF